MRETLHSLIDSIKSEKALKRLYKLAQYLYLKE